MQSCRSIVHDLRRDLAIAYCEAGNNHPRTVTTRGRYIEEPRLRIYCDTSTLFHNMKGDDVSGELKALERLLEYRSQGKLVMYRSRVVLSEIVATKDLEQRERLVADYDVLDQIPHDERVVGFHNQWDKFGGVSYPLVSDIQNDKLYLEIRVFVELSG
jgi:hypothetical protein